MPHGPDDIATPWDLVAHSRSPMHPRFRRLNANSEPLGGLPFGFILGPPIAPGNDWTIFAEEASARGLVEADHRVLIAYQPATERDAADFAASLETQIFAGQVTVLTGADAHAEAQDRLKDVDTVVYLSGRVVFDSLALERICRMTRISRLLVVPLAEATARLDRPVVVPATPRDWPAEEPHRHVRGLNLALPASMARELRDVQGLASGAAALGAYFAPVFVPELVASAGEAAPRRRVSIIIPFAGNVFGASASISSLLRQDEPDLEVVVWATGAAATLAQLLEWRFNGKLRIDRSTKLSDVISATDGDYVGTLWAGDTLSSTAVRSVAERLDLDAAISVAQLRQGEGGEGEEATAWKHTPERRLSTASFAIFRKSTWQRGARDERSDDHLGLLLALAGLGAVETLRGDQLKRSRWRLPSLSLDDPKSAPERFRREAQARGIARHWSIGAGAAETAQARARLGHRLVVVWPDYTRDNAYQRLLYGRDEGTEYVAGDIEAAIKAVEALPGTSIVFHIHWTNRIFRLSEDPAVARAEAETFLLRVAQFKALGGTVVWTLHNIASHNSQHFLDELEFGRKLVALADRVHVHSLRSMPEIEAHFPIPSAKLRIARHGNYRGAYADFVPRSIARQQLGLAEEDDVLLFTGSLRAYKGAEKLIAAVRELLPAHSGLKLVLAGDSKGSESTDFLADLSPTERRCIVLIDRFLDNDELQLYFRAADAAVYPYDEILTSGSVLLALTFAVPVIAPRFGMIEETAGDARILYEREEPSGLEAAISQLLAVKQSGGLEAMRDAAQRAVASQAWQPFAETVLDEPVARP